jgi:3-oxoacyl-[acyl-carrier-protein] synthase II
MKRKRYGISGIGLATPAGCTLKTVYDALSNCQPLFQLDEIFANDSRRYPVSRVDDRSLEHGLSLRQSKKLDRFTVLSLAATRRALEDAGIAVNSEDCQRIGTMVGNCTAGWKYVEPMMYGLYTEGMETINSYVATAWFPAAPQGEASILFGLGGHSKTVSADRLSSGFAVAQSLQVLDGGHVNIMLAGGAESPFSALVFNAFLQSERLSSSGQYLPFSPLADGNLLGEGAVFLALEDLNLARDRGVTPHAEILAVQYGNSLANAMHSCLRKASLSATEVDCIVLDAGGHPIQDEAEYLAIEEVFAANPQIYISAPKSIYGDLLGANVAASIAIACLSLENQVIFPTVDKSNTIKSPAIGKHIIEHPKPSILRNVMVNARDSEGRAVSVLLGKVC